MGKMDEMIMVVERAHIFNEETPAFDGLAVSNKVVKTIFNNCKDYTEMRRGDAEEDPTYKQLITYAVIRRGEEVFLYKRLGGGGEQRLHSKLSIGVGGHMNRINDIQDLMTNVECNVYRELQEELYFDIYGEEPTFQVIGFINDDTNEVGRVHIGVLVFVDLDEGENVSVRETDVLEGYWVRAKDLMKTPLYEQLENWSQIAAGTL